MLPLSRLDSIDSCLPSLVYQGTGDTENAKVFFERIAGLNQLNSINYSLVRHKARRMLDSL